MWKCPLRTDSASCTSLESFIQPIPFCNSCILSMKSKIVSRSSTNFLLANVSNVEPWNRFGSSISLRLFSWASRRSQFCFNNCSWRNWSSCRRRSSPWWARQISSFCDSIISFNFWLSLELVFSNLCLTISENLLSLSFQKNLICSLSELCLWVSWTLETCDSNVEQTTGLSHLSLLTDDDRQDDKPSSERSARLRRRWWRHRRRSHWGTAARTRTPGCIRHPPSWSGRWVHNLWEAFSRPGCQGPQRSRTGGLSTTSWKMKLLGRRKNKVIRETVRKEKKWMEKSSQSEKHTTRWHMEHARENGMSADLEPRQCDIIWTRKKQSRDADNRRKHTNDKGATMRDAFMMIGIRTTPTDSQVFHVTSHIVGLVVLCAEIPIHLLSMHQTCWLLTCTRIPCRGSHCENGRVRCCIHKNIGKRFAISNLIWPNRAQCSLCCK